MHAESATNHIHEDRRHHFRIDNQNHDSQQDIKDGHERRHNLRYVGDTVHAANHHDANKQSHRSAHDGRTDIKGVGKRKGDAVGLHRWHEETRSQDCGDGKHHREPFAVQTLLNIIGRSATELAFVFFLIDLRQSSLGEGRACAQKGDDPHPHDGTWAAVAYGCGHTHDVTRAHAPRQSHRKCLKRGDARLL